MIGGDLLTRIRKRAIPIEVHPRVDEGVGCGGIGVGEIERRWRSGDEFAWQGNPVLVIDAGGVVAIRSGVGDGRGLSIDGCSKAKIRVSRAAGRCRRRTHTIPVTEIRDCDDRDEIILNLAIHGPAGSGESTGRAQTETRTDRRASHCRSRHRHVEGVVSARHAHLGDRLARIEEVLVIVPVKEGVDLADTGAVHRHRCRGTCCERGDRHTILVIAIGVTVIAVSARAGQSITIRIEIGAHSEGSDDVPRTIVGQSCGIRRGQVAEIRGAERHCQNAAGIVHIRAVATDEDAGAGEFLDLIVAHVADPYVPIRADADGKRHRTRVQRRKGATRASGCDAIHRAGTLIAEVVVPGQVHGHAMGIHPGSKRMNRRLQRPSRRKAVHPGCILRQNDQLVVGIEAQA